MYSKLSWQEDKRRKSIFMLSSLALHLLLFIILHLAGMGIGKAEHRGEFDLQAIKVVNMIAKAKDAITRKTKSRSKPSQKRPKAGRRKHLPDAKLRTVAKHRTSAQEVAERIIEAGISAIWNFTNVKLKVPYGVIVQKEDLSSGYAVLSVKIRKLHGK